MSSQSIASLSIGTLKSILFTNHVNAGLILEKGELVLKVKDLVEEERRGRERQRLMEEMEEEEMRVLREERAKELEKREKEKVPSEADVASGSDGTTDPTPTPPPLPAKAQAMAAHLERTGLCVICQDEEANIAIVDCGYVIC